ncbi:hypothetical protein [Pseudolysinimonas sp.]|uniref:hypothetical protein n=1 Tax=Pseudolysinimonas sp. TaxID=2680009 RepID=UPI003F7F5911
MTSSEPSRRQPEPAPPAAPAAPGSLDAPPENVQRGVALALIVLPAGIVVWDLLWTFGLVASIVAFGVSWGALRLYRLGSNGAFSRTGAIAVLVITAATMVLAYISGFAVELIPSYLDVTGRSVADALVDGRFWQQVFAAIADPRFTLQLVIAVAFTALGCARILIAAFRSTRPAAPLAPQPPSQADEPRA